MLSETSGDTTTPLLEETIHVNLVRTTARHPNVEALVSVDQQLRLTYREFVDEVGKVAKGLMALCVAKGDRVGIWSPNVAEWVLVQYATAQIGAIMVSLNPAYRTSEIEYALNQSGVSVLVSAEAHVQSDYRGMLDEVAERTEVERIVYLGTDDWQTLLDAGSTSISDVELAARSAELNPNDPINIQYTSGTTGFPKGATLSHRNILNNGYFIGEACGYSDLDRVCTPVHFYQCFGMVLGNLACTTHGATMVIPAKSFDPVAVLETVQDERCTSLYGVPTMFIAEFGEDLSKFDLSSLRTGIMAGSLCPIEVMKRVVDEMHMDEVTIAYGMTETSPVSTQTSTDDPIDKRVSTVGRVQPHISIKVVDPETGEVVQRGQSGEFMTKGYSVMLGYWTDPERTAEAITEDGWMHTGDLAVMDDEGYVNIVGRIKDMIIRGGENVYPREIEEYLHTHDAIADVQVIGVPDIKYGEQIMAWIQLRDDAPEMTEEQIKDFCRDRIAHFKVPAYVKFVDAFPMTVTGKVQKFVMREQSIAELGLGAAAAVEHA